MPDQKGDETWVDSFEPRFKNAVKLIVIFFSLLMVRLYYLQIQKGQHYRLLRKANATKELSIAPRRGRMYDRHGNLLAESRPYFEISLSPMKVTDDAIESLSKLLRLPQEQKDEISKQVFERRARGQNRPVKLFKKEKGGTVLARERATIVEENRRMLPGVNINVLSERVYPMGAAAGHLLGYVEFISTDEYSRCKAQGCSQDKRVGRFGAEALFEPLLAGRKGVERFARDAHQNRLPPHEAELFISEPLFEPAESGQDIYLTIDHELQKVAGEAMGDRRGAVVALSVKTGEVLALVSKPALDPNFMGARFRPAAEYNALKTHPGQPFLDKSLGQHYPPGSTFKFVSALAALEDNKVTPKEKINCPGYYEAGTQIFRCTSVHRRVNLDLALQRSCNVYFWELGSRVGMDRMAQVARDFGFGSPSSLGMNKDIPGTIPTKHFYTDRGGHRLGHTLNMATGQGDVEITVMQLASAYLALANNGKLLLPRLLHKRSSDTDSVVDYANASVLRQKVAIREENLELLKPGMWNAVNRPGGTAFRLGRSALIEIAGKTGTAEVRGKKSAEKFGKTCSATQSQYCDHAWFAGYAPASSPEIVVAVVVENGGGGGRIAAPIAKQVFEAYVKVQHK